MALSLTYQGETLSLAAWARRLNMHKQTLWARFNLGWSVERMLTTPVGAHRPARPKPEVAPSLFAPHIPGPAIVIGGRWIPAAMWLAAMAPPPREEEAS